MISKQEVKHIAKLARLGLTEEEITKYQKELSSILDYIEKLKEVDVSNIAPASHPFEVKNVMRKDKASEKRSSKSVALLSPQLKLQQAKSEKLLDLAPETKDGYLKVKSIIKLPLPSFRLRKRR